MGRPYDVVPEYLGPGLFLVRYEEADQLAPERQELIVLRLKEAALNDELAGVVFVVGPSVATVDADVPKFWLTLTEDPALTLKAIAVVSTSLGVRMAAKGFAIANVLRNVDVAVQAFVDEAQARAWVAGRLMNALLTGPDAAVMPPPSLSAHG